MGQAFSVVLLLVIGLSGMADSLRAADAPDAEDLTRMLLDADVLGNTGTFLRP